MSDQVLEGLQRLAPELAGEGASVEGLQRLSGGASMETWAFVLVGSGGRDELVLRRRTAPMARHGHCPSPGSHGPIC